ncbi:B-cell receptor CD22 [Chanos chanos]|uniref:B-cell receptor CD22 n=1 Tax=Chanos chanos TaxID=29144 RepID=A0A6J2W4K6_CHACN|nr:sialoadhesin-like [Chanos chanos]
MALKRREMLSLWIFLQLTIADVMPSDEWAVKYKSNDACVLEGSTVDFSCSYNYPRGLLINTLKWFKPRRRQKQDGSQQGVFVYHTDSKQIEESYRGRTEFENEDKKCTLRLHNVSVSDIGRYFFRFETTSYGEMWTGMGGIFLQLAVLPLSIRVDSSRKKDYIEEGERVTLTCGTNTCTPTNVPFSWFKDDRQLDEVTGSSLILLSVSPEDYGNYSCELAHDARISAQRLLLDVRYRPKNVSVALSPPGIIKKGNSLTLTCESQANPAAGNFIWFTINGTVTSQIGSGRSFTVFINNEDGGQYFCEARNALGSINSTVKTLQEVSPDAAGDIYENVEFSHCSETEESTDVLLYAQLKLPSESERLCSLEAEASTSVIYSLPKADYSHRSPLQEVRVLTDQQGASCSHQAPR